MKPFPKAAAPTEAVIYCLVSSTKQTKAGDGLRSQETRCREYARYKGYAVIGAFHDDVSGGRLDRPGIKALLSFVRKHRASGIAIIIDDLSRLARDIRVHQDLREPIASAGGQLESPSIEFGDGPASIFQENLMACLSQHQRQKNAEQTSNRMRVRLMSGYWVFQPPIGYEYRRADGRGKMLVRRVPHASIIKEALEGFASGRFETQVEVMRFLEGFEIWPKDLPNGEIRNQRVFEMLTRPVYAGHVEAPNWDIALRKGPARRPRQLRDR